MDYKAERQLKEAERLLSSDPTKPAWPDVHIIKESDVKTWTCRCGTSWLMEDKACADCGRWQDQRKE